MAINYYIANATGKLDKLTDRIEKSTEEAKKLGTKFLTVDDIDIIFSHDPNYAITELGAGGYSPNGHRIDIYFDAEQKVPAKEITAQLLHEMHHCMRWRDPGYGNTFAETMVS